MPNRVSAEVFWLPPCFCINGVHILPYTSLKGGSLVRRFICLLLVFSMVTLLGISLSGCGGKELITFTWQVDSMPQSLDPQLAESVCERTAAEHLFRGLMMLDENGQPVVDCAKSYTISADQLTYTFTLKDDLFFHSYEKDSQPVPLSAKDFVFGITRVFLPDTFSPYAQQLSGIAGSSDVLAGGDPSLLGISAPDDKTVIIRLSAPDETFLTKLCCPGAMPCNEEFFRSTKGSYGLSSKQLLTNGDFQLYNWAEQGVFLRRQDAPAFAVNNLRLVLADPHEPVVGLEALQEGVVTGTEYRGEIPDGYTAQSFSDTLWALVFNCNEPQLANLAIRQSIGQLVHQSLGVQLPISTFSSANGILPPALPLPDGSGHQEQAISSFGEPLQLYQQGLSALQQNKLSGITVLLPQQEEIVHAFENTNQLLQKELAAFFSLQQLPEEELSQKVASGDFSIALVPLSPKSSEGSEFLQQILDLCSLPSTSSLQALEDTTLSASQRKDYTLSAEQEVLQQAGIVPVWFEQRSFLTRSGWSGIIYSPFGPRLNLRNATFQ